jgi:GNAT superfamily N-acetyltransferase
MTDKSTNDRQFVCVVRQSYPLEHMPTPPPFTIPAVHLAIDQCCGLANFDTEIQFRRAGDRDLGSDASHVFGVVASDNKAGSSTLTYFSIAYSTWDGRVLRVDCQSSDHIDVRTARVLARIAAELDCTRLTWQYYGAANPLAEYNPQELPGWLTLYWKRDAMIKFAGSIEKETSEAVPIPEAIQAVLATLNSHETFRLRLANSNDVGTILRCARGLAVYEKEPDAVHVSAAQYKVDGFQSEPPLYVCLLIEHIKSSYACGMAFCYFGFDRGGGSFLYLEDLFLEQRYRGKGAGSLAMTALARIGLSVGCTKLVWQALDWNTPALNFYSKLGATVEKGLNTARYANESLLRFSRG